MDLDSILVNLNATTLTAVGLGGTTLGLYFAALNRFKKAEKVIAGMVTFVVIGWSFYLPFAFASAVTNPDADVFRFVGSMALWVWFTVAATVSYQVASRLAEFRKKE
jgi:Na+/phosphate symporter